LITTTAVPTKEGNYSCIKIMPKDHLQRNMYWFGRKGVRRRRMVAQNVAKDHKQREREREREGEKTERSEERYTHIQLLQCVETMSRMLLEMSGTCIVLLANNR
jgi:hypothetical protein